MQITSTLTQNKMEPLNGNVSNASATAAPADIDHISGAFCHQFYVTVSENRTSISKYYGHESTFQFDNEKVTGAAEIAKLYSSLPDSTHFKIHNIKGLPTLHNSGVLVQVLGALNHRPFIQTFILGQQGQKKYYIEVDYFQYLDQYFDIKDQSRAATSSASSVSANGHASSNGVNGQVTKPAKVPEQQQVKQTPQKSQQTPKKAEETPRQPKQETPKTQEKEIAKSPKVLMAQQPQQQHPVPPHLHQQVHAAPPVPHPEPVPQEQPKPRTWATLVGQGGKQQPPQQGYSQQQIQQMHQMQQQQAAALHQHQQAQAAQAMMFQQHQQQQQQRAQAQAQQAAQHRAVNDSHPQGDADRDASLGDRKIYLGGITREIVPSNTAQAETEIKQVFYKYGEVEEVRMPRKVLDSPNDTSKHAFAFITMRAKQGVQAIFAAATRDEQGVWKLPLKLDAFGFDGLAQVSEQRDPPNGGFRGGRGGGGFGQRGGGYFRRGGPGGPRGGGMRGGFNNGLNGQH